MTFVEILIPWLLPNNIIIDLIDYPITDSEKNWK